MDDFLTILTIFYVTIFLCVFNNRTCKQRKEWFKWPLIKRVLLNYLFNPVHFTSPKNIAVVLNNREYQNPCKWSVKYMTMLVV